MSIARLTVLLENKLGTKKKLCLHTMVINEKFLEYGKRLPVTASALLVYQKYFDFCLNFDR